MMSSFSVSKLELEVLDEATKPKRKLHRIKKQVFISYFIRQGWSEIVPLNENINKNGSIKE